MNQSAAFVAALLVASCSQQPTAPTTIPAAAKAESVADGRVGSAGVGDVKNGPIEIKLVHVEQTGGVPAFYAGAGGTYTVRPNKEVEIYIQIWTSDTVLAEAPRLIVDWGVGGGVNERDRIHCGPCRLSRTYDTEGLYTVTVTMDDRVGGVTSRSFALDVTNPVSDAPPTAPPVPGSLTTLFAQNNGQAGNMFDLTASKNLTITGFDANLDAGPVTIEVYHKTGTSAGSEAVPGAWTLLGSATVVGAGSNLPTKVNIGGLSLAAGQVHGIYVTATTGTPINYTNGGPTTFSNADLSLTTNSGNLYPFAGTFFPRQWNGTVYYTVP